MLFKTLPLVTLIVGIQAVRSPRVKNLIVFGDSYTDEGRLSYFINHGGDAPPVGVAIPTSNTTAGGSYSWPYYASKKLGATTYNYAVSGAVCSNKIIYRYFDAINGPFPSVIDYEVPAFKADLKYASKLNTPFLRNVTPQNSVYTLWVGTNDLGEGGFLRERQMKGKTIADYIDCVWSMFDEIYSTGGRRFVLFTQAPLEISPLYAAIQNGGAGDNNGFWTNKTAYDTLEYESKIREYTTAVNTIYDYGVPFQLLVKKRWPGASFIIFDTHQIIQDIHDKPEKYLEAPANVNGYYTCPDLNAEDGCAVSQNPLSSFLWYDSLHPSSRADEIIGTELAKALDGKSSYATYYS